MAAGSLFKWFTPHTHMSHEFDYETLPGKLPGGVFMAYDGLRFQF